MKDKKIPAPPTTPTQSASTHLASIRIGTSPQSGRAWGEMTVKPPAIVPVCRSLAAGRTVRHT